MIMSLEARKLRQPHFFNAPSYRASAINKWSRLPSFRTESVVRPGVWWVLKNLSLGGFVFLVKCDSV